jgi:insertion element IS1 protein InsB
MDYVSRGASPETKKLIVKMSVNGSGIRDTSRVLGVSQNTVIAVLKKRKESSQM